jgi:hypothetical protein
VKLLLLKGANVNLQTLSGWSPLHYISRNGNVEIAKILISNGADINLQRDDGKTPLHIAVTFNNIEIVKLLISSGVNVNTLDMYERNPMTLAIPYFLGSINRNNLTIIKMLLKVGCKVGDRFYDLIDDLSSRLTSLKDLEYLLDSIPLTLIEELKYIYHDHDEVMNIIMILYEGNFLLSPTYLTNFVKLLI